MIGKAELLSTVKNKSGVSKEVVLSVLRSYRDVILAELKKDGEITFMDLGKFKITDRSARTAVNPQDRTKIIQIPAKKLPKFSSSKKFKEFTEGKVGIEVFDY